jgi:hypothetical protein
LLEHITKFEKAYILYRKTNAPRGIQLFPIVKILTIKAIKPVYLFLFFYAIKLRKRVVWEMHIGINFSGTNPAVPRRQSGVQRSISVETPSNGSQAQRSPKNIDIGNSLSNDKTTAGGSSSARSSSSSTTNVSIKTNTTTNNNNTGNTPAVKPVAAVPSSAPVAVAATPAPTPAATNSATRALAEVLLPLLLRVANNSSPAARPIALASTPIASQPINLGSGRQVLALFGAEGIINGLASTGGSLSRVPPALASTVPPQVSLSTPLANQPVPPLSLDKKPAPAVSSEVKNGTPFDTISLKG